MKLDPSSVVKTGRSDLIARQKKQLIAPSASFELIKLRNIVVYSNCGGVLVKAFKMQTRNRVSATSAVIKLVSFQSLVTKASVYMV